MASHESDIEQKIDALLAAATGVTIDSRTANPGDLFFAIHGKQFDGNRFAQKALDAGCIGAVVSERELAGTDERFIWVPDGLQALQEAAQRKRNTWQFPVLALTGSNGKTTTKELIRDVLATTKSTAATIGNFNNEIGVPLTILRMPDDLEVAVLEMGANAQGEIRRLVEIAEPTHALITNIGLAHLEGFGGPEGVKKGKSEIFGAMRAKQSGHAFARAADPVLMEVTEGLERTAYGTEDCPPMVRAVKAGHGAFEWWDGQVWHGPVPTALEGTHNLQNIATALAVGLHFGVDPADASAAIAAYRPENNRSEWRNTGKNRVLLDAYNANPSSMNATLQYFAEALAAQATPPNALMVLGEMGELGAYSRDGHADVARLAGEIAVDLPGSVILVGPSYADAIGELLLPENVFCCAKVADVERMLRAHPPVGQTILLKGSRSVALETLLPLL